MRALTVEQLTRLRRGRAEGNRLAKAIELSGVTQMQIAEATGLTQSYISNVARNCYATITVDNARLFSDFFGCSIEDLFPARAEVAS